MLPLILSVDLNQMAAYTNALVTKNAVGFFELLMVQELCAFFFTCGGHQGAYRHRPEVHHP